MFGTTASLPSRSLELGPLTLPAGLVLPLVAALLVAVPVFVQAPLVRVAPLPAALATAVLVAAGLLLERFGRGNGQALGPLLVGFSGSWLAGCLFWGWFRLHPVCHLPIEAFALPLAVAGLNGRWRLAGAFYLASLAGTAATDAAIAATGLMDLWPQVLAAPLQEAPLLLRQAGEVVLEPSHLLLISAIALGLLQACRLLWSQGGVCGRVASATLVTTLAVDGLFLASALLAPQLSGLI